ncbi:uncharacterized protein LOC127469834 [Manacus candei]|uniref:uncharacterized protein LOC127469834 n=1 Tax=Manacus candei TaxID=415023 RepID=UPI002227762E|nr:uncharacterized protein LOC127469834 [Manacus candei]
MKYFSLIIKKSFELWTVHFSTAKDCEQLVCKLQVDTNSSYGQDNAQSSTFPGAAFVYSKAPRGGNAPTRPRPPPAGVERGRQPRRRRRERAAALTGRREAEGDGSPRLLVPGGKEGDGCACGRGEGGISSNPRRLPQTSRPHPPRVPPRHEPRAPPLPAPPLAAGSSAAANQNAVVRLSRLFLARTNRRARWQLRSRARALAGTRARGRARGSEPAVPGARVRREQEGSVIPGHLPAGGQSETRSRAHSLGQCFLLKKMSNENCAFPGLEVWRRTAPCPAPGVPGVDRCPPPAGTAWPLERIGIGRERSDCQHGLNSASLKYYFAYSHLIKFTHKAAGCVCN